MVSGYLLWTVSTIVVCCLWGLGKCRRFRHWSFGTAIARGGVKKVYAQELQFPGGTIKTCLHEDYCFQEALEKYAYTPLQFILHTFIALVLDGLTIAA